MKKFIYLFLISIPVITFAQNDCIDAIMICENSNYRDLEATGVGVQELEDVGRCVFKETNSIWFILKINKGGNLGFVLKPTLPNGNDNNDINIDFDFYIFDTKATCKNIGQAIRCTTTNPRAVNQGNNMTGLRQGASDEFQSPNEGDSFLKLLTVNAGESYFLVIDRPLGDSSFKIDWTGTATFNKPPTINGTNFDLKQCGNGGFAFFDLTQNTAKIIGDQTGVEITYHISVDDSKTGNNKILNPKKYKNTVNPQTIYSRITDIKTKCFSASSFKISADNIFAIVPENIRVCDDDDDGVLNFDLTQNTDKIIGSQIEVEVTYYISANDAQTGNNKISNPKKHKNTSKIQVIWARLESTTNTCFGVGSFEIEVYDLPVLKIAPYVLKQCGANGFNKFNLAEINLDIVKNITTEVFSYYKFKKDAEAGKNQIENSETYLNKIINTDTIWVRIENNNHCYRVVEVSLVVKPSEIPKGFLINFYECDTGSNTTDGIATFDFSSVTQKVKDIFSFTEVKVFYYQNESDATSERNEIKDPSNYKNNNSPRLQKIWIRADSKLGNDCLGNGHHITLIVNDLPQFEVNPTEIICLNLKPITLNTFNPNKKYSYVWKDSDKNIISKKSTVVVDSGGVYSVVAFGSDCESVSKIITVSESIIATLTQDMIKIVNDLDNNSITINSRKLGIGDYEYSLDKKNGVYQYEPFFENVEPGIHTVYVRDKNNCGIVSLEVPVIGFMKFFTPNNDGENDYWQIKGISTSFNFVVSSIFIYDRFGKIIAKIDPLGDGWDGTFNGIELPSDDYWFYLKLIGKNENIIYNRKGHFSLIRR